MAFIESMNADSLNITEEEFERYMSREAVPNDPSKLHSCEALRLMDKNLAVLKGVKERHDQVMSQALQLDQDMQDFKTAFIAETQRVLRDNPLIIKPRKTKVDIDSENTDCDLLPPPLTPIVASSGNGVTASPEPAT